MMTCCEVRGGSEDVGVGARMDLEVEGTVGGGGYCIMHLYCVCSAHLNRAYLQFISKLI